MFVMVPFEDVRDGRLNGYRIGTYPAKTQPLGFVEVTADTMRTKLSPHFELRQFLCKQPGGFPKYVVLSEPLILKLERISRRSIDAGHDVDTLTVMSGYRTPFYNESIGNVRDSQHTAGTAADIFVDETSDGRMDDLDRDGVVTATTRSGCSGWSTAWTACRRRCSRAASATTAPPPRTAPSSTSTSAAGWPAGAAEPGSPAQRWRGDIHRRGGGPVVVITACVSPSSRVRMPRRRPRRRHHAHAADRRRGRPVPETEVEDRRGEVRRGLPPVLGRARRSARLRLRNSAPARRDQRLGHPRTPRTIGCSSSPARCAGASTTTAPTLRPTAW